MDVLVQDLRFALRSLKRTKGFTAVVIAVMALGIGVNAMIFSMVYAVLMRPFPLPSPERLVHVGQNEPKRGEDDFNVSLLNYRDFRDQTKSLTAIGSYWDHQAFVSFGSGDVERFYGATVTADFLPALGVLPALGRNFTREDEVYGKNWLSVIISDRIWRQRYAAGRDVLGKTLRLNGRVRTIVGVMPPNFRFPEIQDFWIPMGFNPADEHRNDYALEVIGRLKPGSTARQADAEVATIMKRIAIENPKTSEGVGAHAKPWRDWMSQDIRPMMILLMSAVGFVLLIACANVANLMLARASNRRREISVRLALGATRGRIIRQLLTESVLVAVVGALIGIALAVWGNQLWLAAIPLEVPYWMHFDIDAPVLAFTVGISVIAGLLFGLAPALHATDTKLSESLRDGAAQSGAGRHGNRLRNGLVIAEIALSLVLLIGAGLMIRSFLRIQERASSLHTAGVLTAQVLLPFANFPEPDQRRTFFRELLPRLATLPGVRSVSAVNNLPLGQNDWTRRVVIEGTAKDDSKRAPTSCYAIAFPGFFATFGIPLHQGRDFTPEDRGNMPRVAIVNQSAARKLWPRKEAIGQRLRFQGEADSIGWATVVGVVGDVPQNINGTTVHEQVYVPHEQDPNQNMTLLLSGDASPASMSAGVRRAVRAVSPDAPVYEVRSMVEALRLAQWQRRLFSGLMAVFGMLALVIAAVGIYGVMAYSVAQRTQEIGIRMALGADRRDVVGMVVGQAMRLTLLGCGIGLAVAYGLTRFMAAMLFDVSPNDPPTFAGVAIILAVSGLLAAWLPARRATRVDPMIALRCD